MNDPRRFIKEAIEHDKSLDLALASYAEFGHSAYLSCVIDLTARIHTSAIAEARRIGRADLIHPPRPPQQPQPRKEVHVTMAKKKTVKKPAAKPASKPCKPKKGGC